MSNWLKEILDKAEERADAKRWPRSEYVERQLERLKKENSTNESAAPSAIKVEAAAASCQTDND